MLDMKKQKQRSKSCPCSENIYGKISRFTVACW